MVEPWRVAQLAVDRGPDYDGSRGSGYLIAPGRVLTAAHVVAGASSVRVRLDVDQASEIDVPADTWWADPRGHDGTDLAVITIPETATAGRTFESARFGQISDSAAVLMVEAFGFPLLKLRDDPADAGRQEVFRDFEQARGRAPVAANRRQGTLAVYLNDPPPPQRQGEPSPWEGMSGGSVWAAGRIVGVVAEHHAREGPGRLTARRVDRAYEQLSASDLDQLSQLLGLPATLRGLPDVVPAEHGQLVRSAYLAQVRDIAPDALVGRENELADWTGFCAGTDPYAWWQAKAWAGKSALASWFVTHPPRGVDVVSFFVTGRLSGQADSDQFLADMIEQLGALLDPAGQGPLAPAGARAGVWLTRLAAAAALAEERARRLVIVVDGLDEDEAGTTPPRGRRSIASLLPRHPPSGARFVVTSRLGRDLPADVPSGHPLRACKPRSLRVSPVAVDIQRRAEQELQDLLAGDQIAVDVVGYITGSGGGLTRDDLSALTRAPPYKLDPLLGGVFGRSLRTRASNIPRAQTDQAARVYLFAHDTLEDLAAEQLGNELGRYQQRVHEWIASYAGLGWPETTPGYAIRGYSRLLTATADLTRLFELARDPRRHAFLLEVTGSDYTALAEIGASQSLIAARHVPDLKALAELAAYRHVLSIRNLAIPPDLPIVWAQLTRFDHAEALARTLGDLHDRTRALTGLATAAAQAGDPDRAHRFVADAEALAHTIADPGDQARALSDLTTAAAQAGDPDRGEALARTLTDPGDQARALTDLATAAAQAGDPDRGEALLRTIPDPRTQTWALAVLATAIAQAGDPDRGEALARTLTNPGDQARALALLVTVAAQSGDLDRAHRLAADAEALARTADPDYQVRTLTDLATAIAEAGDLDRALRLAADAEAVARTIINPADQARALTLLIAVAAEAGELDRAHRLAADAEALAESIYHNTRSRNRAFADLAVTVAQAGDLDRAEAICGAITSTSTYWWTCADLAIAAADAGDFDRGEALARAIPENRAQVLALMAVAAAEAGDLDRAHRLAADAEFDPKDQARALSLLATAAAQAGDLDRAHRLAAEAEAVARTVVIDPKDQARVLGFLAIVVAHTGDFDRAEALARAIPNNLAQALALIRVAAAAQAGDIDRARRLTADAESVARAIKDEGDRARMLAELATAAAQAGDIDRGEALARGIKDKGDRARMLAKLAIAAAQAGDIDRARRLAADAESVARAIKDEGDQARVLADLVTTAAQAGDGDRARRLAADAEALARAIVVPYIQVQTLADLATAAQLGDRDRAHRLAADAEALARAIPYGGLLGQASALTYLATAAAQAGDIDRGEALASAITDPDDQARALADLATAAAQAGNFDRGEALASAITDPDDQARALADLATAAARADEPDRAKRFLALVLVIDLSGIWWLKTALQLFPFETEGAWDVLAGAYLPQI
jgi:hypothetical protein